jgi:DNA-binding NarL/FixJ family response regulator
VTGSTGSPSRLLKNMSEKENSAVRAVICNSSPIFREGIAEMCRREGSIEIVAEVETGRAAFEQVKRLNPDIVFMDLRTPEMNGPETIRRIKAAKPETIVLVLTLYDDQRMVSQCLSAGASEYISSSTHMAQLKKLVLRLRRRGRFPRAA